MTDTRLSTLLIWALLIGAAIALWLAPQNANALENIKPKDVVVAIIDTGADLNHKDLSGFIWQNPREIPGNNIDDDHNGYVDDINGWNFAANSANLSDTHGHGTHVAGLVVRNFQRPTGLKLMILRYYQDGLSGADHLTNTVRAIEYAIKMGANIINYSGGGPQPHPKELAAITNAQTAGILFVAAAGNEASLMRTHPFFPASYGLSNILSVAATGEANGFFKHSNYDAQRVDLAAPGENIYSSLPNNRHGLLSGTSQATAIVSGAAAQVMREFNDFKNPKHIIDALVRTGRFNPSLLRRTREQTQLDVSRTLTMRPDTVNAAGWEVNLPRFADFL